MKRVGSWDPDPIARLPDPVELVDLELGDRRLRQVGRLRGLRTLFGVRHQCRHRADRQGEADSARWWYRRWLRFPGPWWRESVRMTQGAAPCSVPLSASSCSSFWPSSERPRRSGAAEDLPRPARLEGGRRRFPFLTTEGTRRGRRRLRRCHRRHCKGGLIACRIRRASAPGQGRAGAPGVTVIAALALVTRRRAGCRRTAWLGRGLGLVVTRCGRQR